MGKEVILPKSIRHAHPEWFEHPTILGYPQGAKKQYRYGNLHIREYDDHITVHEDLFDPRTDPVSHIIHEAPEILVGTVCGTLAGGYVYKKTKDITGSAAAGGLAGLAVGALVFAAGAYVADRIREA